MNNKNFVRSGLFDNLLFIGGRRYYIEDLTQRDYILENTTPREITISNEKIADSSWGSLLVKITDLLISKRTKSESELLDFNVPWSKKQMFSVNKKTNHKPLSCGLYINCNHTALHSCWLLQDLLDFFEIDKSDVFLIIHRAPSSEPKEIRSYIKNENKKQIKSYLCGVCRKTQEEAESIIGVIDNCLNKILQKLSRSYNDFFLFDDYYYSYGYFKRTKEFLQNRDYQRDEFIATLDILADYYKNGGYKE